MKYCSKCGQELKENAKFCSKCGNSFVKGKKTKKEKGKGSKKVLLIVIPIVIIFFIGLLLLGLYFIGNIDTTSNNKIINIINKDKVKITKNESSTIQYEDFNNGLISLKIPKGWKVEVAALDYIHYTFKVYNPKNPNYMLLFGLKQEGNLKTEKARSVYAKYYPDSPFAKLAAIDPQTTEGYYKIWNDQAKYINTVDLSYEYMPYYNDFKVLQNLGSTALGGDILRATYKDNKGNLNQGLFTANVKSIGTYYINENIFNLMSAKVDVSPLNTYNIITMTAPDEEFNNWQPILDYCLGTLKFSDKFLNGFNQEEQTLVNSIKSNAKIYNEISDGIMDSWEKRNNSYDITSQKQSDATLGYERVYDTETNEIYRAYNGFTDDYKGERYKSITDDMYNLPTSGYIEK